MAVLGLFLLAPAFYLGGEYGVARPFTPCGKVSIVHGRLDDVVPYKNSVEFKDLCGAELKLVDDGHRLKNSYAELDDALRALIDLAVARES